MPGRAASATLGIVALAGMVAAGCAVGPAYKRPEAPVSPAYEEKGPPAAESARMWKPAEPNDAAARGKWWEVFGDPALNGLEEQIEVSNQNVAQAEAQFRGARAVARGARGDLFPQISANPSVTRSRFSASRQEIPGATAVTTNVYQVGGTASWELDVFGRIRRNVESAVETAQASAGDLEAVRLSMHADLAVDYFLLRGADAQRDLLETNLDAYEKALQLTVNRHDQGVVSGVDVAQAETQVETTRAQITELELSRRQLEHAIAVLVGKPPAELTIPPVPALPPPPAVPEQLPSDLLERRPDIAAAERRVAAANAQVGVAQAGFFPRLLITATGGWESGSLTQFFSAPNMVWSLGAALAQTLFAGGKVIAAREQAAAAYDATVAVYRESVLTSLQDVEDNLVALRLLARESEEQARAVAAADRALLLARNRYEGGITTYLEVVTAQVVALANERAAVDLLTRRMTASVGLIRALGGGWDASELPSGPAVLAHGPAATGAPMPAEPKR